MPSAAILCDTISLTGHPAVMQATILDATARLFPPTLHPILYAHQGSQYQGSDVVHLDPIWTRLAAPMEAGDTAITVTRTLGFPDAGPFELVIGRECVLVPDGADMTTLTWPVVRAQRGSRAVKHYPTAMVSALPHTIVVSDGATTWDYTARWGYPSSLQVAYTCPGGPSQASWTVQDYGATSPATLTAAPSLGAAVVLADAYGPYWIGIVDEVRPEFRVNGATVEIVARGWAVIASDKRYATSKIFGPTPMIENGKVTPDTSLGPVLGRDANGNGVYPPLLRPRMAIHQICEAARLDLASSFISAGDYRGGDSSLPAPTGDMIGKTALDVWNEITGHGEADGAPVYWYVRGHADDPGHPYLDIVDRPGSATLQVGISDVQRAPLHWRRSEVQNEIIMRFGGGLAAASNPDGITDLGGQIRDRWVDAASQIGSQAVADQTAETIVNQTGRVFPAAESLTVPYPRRVLDLSGNPVPLWRDMTGQIIVVNDIDSGNTKLRGIAQGFLVREHAFDFTRRVATFQTERVVLVADAVGRYLDAAKAPPATLSLQHQGPPLQVGSAQSGMDPKAAFGRELPSAASGPGQGLDGGGGSGSDDNSGIVPYLALAPGVDAANIPANLGDGVNPDSLEIFTYVETQISFRFRVFSGDLLLDKKADVELVVSRVDPNSSAAPEPLFRIQSNGDRHCETLQMAPGQTATNPGDLLFEPGTWIRITCTRTELGAGETDKAAKASLTLRAQKLPGEAPLPSSPAPVIQSVSYGRGTYGSVITINLDRLAAIRFNYGPENIAPDENGDYPSTIGSDLPSQAHYLTAPPLSGGVVYLWKATAVDAQGNTTQAFGNFTG